MYIYLLVGLLVLFALYKERQALGCPNIPTGADCDNANGKAVKGTLPLPSDSNDVIFQKIKKAADFSDRWVMWRIGFILSLPCVLLTYFFLHKRLPDEKEMVVGMFVIAALFYFTLNFYKFHLINYIRDNIDTGVDILKSRSK